MKYSIIYANTIDKKWLKNQSVNILERIQKEISRKLTTKPEIYGKPLRKSLKGYRRLRIGQYRVLFKIDKEKVKIVFIGLKPDVYEKFLKKIK